MAENDYTVPMYDNNPYGQNFELAEPDFNLQPDNIVEIEPPHPLQKYVDAVNLAEDLDEDTLQQIGQVCYEGYTTDDESRSEWLEQNKKGIELAKQITKEKTFPWRGAANIKLPTIADASIKFASRAYSEIIKGPKPVKPSTYGADPQEEKAKRAERISDYMSYQVMRSEVEWESDTDKLLHALPVVGHLFRKRYYCNSEKRTKSEICMPDKLVINIEATSLAASRRYTHIIENVSRNDFVSNERSGIWLHLKRLDEVEGEKDKVAKKDDHNYFNVLEVYTWLDMDGDGFEEPYIVTLEEESRQVLRINARYTTKGVKLNDDGEVLNIKPKRIFTEYTFLPSIDCTYYASGFGQLLQHLTSVANSLINQITDAGTLNNLNSGYLSREIKIKSGRERFEVGEWKRTNATAMELKNGVLPLPTREPSPTLFNLLGLVLELTKDLASVKDVLAGDAPGLNVPASTVLALIEQGMKTFNAIYKRIYRSLQAEFSQLYEMNYEYLDEEEYYKFLDEEKSVGRADFEDESMDVEPVADPEVSTDMQRLVRAEALKGTIGIPGVDARPIMRTYYEALKLPEDMIEEILPEQDPNAVPPHIQAMIHDAEAKEADLLIKEQELDLKQRELGIKAFETMGKFIKNISDAESNEAGTQLNIYKEFANEVLAFTKLENDRAAKASTLTQPKSESGNDSDNQRGLDSMGQQLNNPSV